MSSISTAGELTYTSTPAGIVFEDTRRGLKLFRITSGTNPYAAQEIYLNPDTGATADAPGYTLAATDDLLWELNGNANVPAGTKVLAKPNPLAHGFVFDASAGVGGASPDGSQRTRVLISVCPVWSGSTIVGIINSYRYSDGTVECVLNPEDCCDENGPDSGSDTSTSCCSLANNIGVTLSGTGVYSWVPTYKLPMIHADAKPGGITTPASGVWLSPSFFHYYAAGEYQHCAGIGTDTWLYEFQVGLSCESGPLWKLIMYSRPWRLNDAWYDTDEPGAWGEHVTLTEGTDLTVTNCTTPTMTGTKTSVCSNAANSLTMTIGAAP